MWSWIRGRDIKINLCLAYIHRQIHTQMFIDKMKDISLQIPKLQYISSRTNTKKLHVAALK